MRVLFLLDIDGTLINTSGVGRRAAEKTVFELTNEKVPLSAKDVAGRTDLFIFNQILEKLSSLNGYNINFSEIKNLYLKNLRLEVEKKSINSLPGVNEFIKDIENNSKHVPALLTGNFEEGAQIKLGQRFQSFEFGAYGDLTQDRNKLMHFAIDEYQKKYYTSPQKIIVVGDTPFDIECARAGGAFAVAVTTGPYTADELSAADMVLDSLEDWPKIMKAVF
ncbi:MAG: HAD hydrolase-like protein [Spirochaetia bacterium]|nr:HAD hydrolase-like protein [Spirochaetia bacterium]